MCYIWLLSVSLGTTFAWDVDAFLSNIIAEVRNRIDFHIEKSICLVGVVLQLCRVLPEKNELIFRFHTVQNGNRVPQRAFSYPPRLTTHRHQPSSSLLPALGLVMRTS